MKALILAGGFGTRLRPLTYTRPKHLLPIANRPHIEHVLDMLVASDVTDVVFLTSYLAEAFHEVVDRAAVSGVKVDVTHEEEPLDTAGALKNAADLVGSDTFLALNGDILSDIDLRPVIEWHREVGAEGTIVLAPVDDPSAFGVVPTDDGGQVLGFIEKPAREEAPTNMINAGLYVLEASVFDRIPTGVRHNAERQLFPEMAADGTLFAQPTDAYWLDIGTPQKLLQANLDALTGRFRTAAVTSPGDTNVVSAASVQIADSAQVVSSCLGEKVVIEADSKVERSVLLPGVVVGHGSEVIGCVLGEQARVVPESRLSGAAVADGQTIS
jgi:mannose-1-phosphate guanylyltransferase